MSVQAFWEQYRYVLLAILIVAAVSALGVQVRGAPVDVAVFRFINTHYTSPVLDTLGIAFYVLGTFEASLLLAGAIIGTVTGWVWVNSRFWPGRRR